MAQFTYYPTTKLFNNIPPNIKNLNHDIQEFLRHRFKVPIMLNPGLYRNMSSFKIRKKKTPCEVKIE